MYALVNKKMGNCMDCAEGEDRDTVQIRSKQKTLAERSHQHATRFEAMESQYMEKLQQIERSLDHLAKTIKQTKAKSGNATLPQITKLRALLKEKRLINKTYERQTKRYSAMQHLSTVGQHVLSTKEAENEIKKDVRMFKSMGVTPDMVDRFNIDEVTDTVEGAKEYAEEMENALDTVADGGDALELDEEVDQFLHNIDTLHEAPEAPVGTSMRFMPQIGRKSKVKHSDGGTTYYMGNEDDVDAYEEEDNVALYANVGRSSDSPVEIEEDEIEL